MSSKYTDTRNIWCGGDPDIEWDYIDTELEERNNQDRIKATLRAVKKDSKD